MKADARNSVKVFHRVHFPLYAAVAAGASHLSAAANADGQPVSQIRCGAAAGLQQMPAMGNPARAIMLERQWWGDG